MAFRKVYRSSYFPHVCCHEFGEHKFSPTLAGDSSTFVSRSFEDCQKLAKSSLPLTSLDSVIKSGQTIDGSVSFRPSDPAVIESSVHSSVSSYIQSHPVETPVPDEN